MKKMSIKLKITLYFTLILFALSAAMLGYTTVIAASSARAELEKTLALEVNKLSNEVKYKPSSEPPDAPQGEQPPSQRGEKSPTSQHVPEQQQTDLILVVPEDYSFLNGNVSLYIYEEGETPTIYGQLFEGLVFDPRTAHKEVITEQKANDKTYLMFARFIKKTDKDKGGGAWIVGAIDNDFVLAVAYDTVKYAVVAVPFVILIAAVLGYLVSKSAFKPVAEITNTANELSKGGDYSKRINLGTGSGEIYKLAETFDGMLETIQKDFEREKQFTNDASHELRTPISIIMAQSELALDGKANEADKTEALQSISRQSHRINKLLTELLSLARSANGKTVLIKENFDLRELSEMVIVEKTDFANTHGISLKLVSDTPVEVFADQTLIMRVLINLITNSIKYGKEGGTTEISVEKRGDNGAVCRIKDNGIGISETDIDKIWDKFFRADTSRTFDENGSFGLGLPMVKSIIEAHGGTISVESVLGEGSVFEFILN